ncbi:MAG TPA: hypothetical protein VGL07_16705 [Buttiauxella sp.]|jgi:hypothetical protein
MSLSLIEKLDLQQSGVELITKISETTDLMERLELQSQYVEIINQLGASQRDVTVPQLVLDFKANAFRKQPAVAFCKTVEEVGQWLDQFISLDEIKAGAVSWIEENPEAIAA